MESTDLHESQAHLPSHCALSQVCTRRLLEIAHIPVVSCLLLICMTWDGMRTMPWPSKKRAAGEPTLCTLVSGRDAQATAGPGMWRKSVSRQGRVWEAGNPSHLTLDSVWEFYPQPFKGKILISACDCTVQFTNPERQRTLWACDEAGHEERPWWDGGQDPGLRLPASLSAQGQDEGPSGETRNPKSRKQTLRQGLCNLRGRRLQPTVLTSLRRTAESTLTCGWHQQ